MKWILLLAALVPQERARRDSYEKLAPYTGVRWKGAAPEVEVQGTWVGLVSINEVKASEIVEYCRKTYGSRWQKRFEEDLVEVLSVMGHKPGATVKLQVKALDTGELKTHDAVPMTKENRKKIWEAASGRAEDRSHPPLPRAAAAEDLDQLRAALEERYAYLKLRPVDLAAAVKAAQAGLADPVPRDALATEIVQLLAPFGDGHTRLAEDVRGTNEYLPFLIGDSKGRLVAFKEDRSGYVDPERPYLRSLDGVPAEEWLKTAARLVPSGSPGFIRSQSVRMLREIALLRRLRGSASRIIDVELASADGVGRTTPSLPSPLKPTYGAWPRAGHRLLDGNVGYLRVDSMGDDPAVLRSLAESMDRFRDTRGLVIDVRDNGGGTRTILSSLFPCFMEKGGDLRVANVAAARLVPGEEPGLGNRSLFPASSTYWNAAERRALETFAASFKPEWTPPANEFSEWHFFALRPKEGVRRYEKPVVILMNSDCFSATDIFLGAFKGWKNVTLLGLPSAGGSGRPRLVTLRNSGLRVQMSSMASFRPDGRLYDGRGIEPDVVVHPEPSDFLGKSDAMLDAALQRLTR